MVEDKIARLGRQEVRVPGQIHQIPTAYNATARASERDGWPMADQRGHATHRGQQNGGRSVAQESDPTRVPPIMAVKSNAGIYTSSRGVGGM